MYSDSTERSFAGALVFFLVMALSAYVLLVTALLIVPAATARNLARTAGGMFWWSILVSVTSAVAGLVLSAQEWAGTATGASSYTHLRAHETGGKLVCRLLLEKKKIAYHNFTEMTKWRIAQIMQQTSAG